MDSKLSISIAIAVVLTLFAALLFYYILTSITDRFIAGIYVGIISVVFSLVGYFLYAFMYWKPERSFICKNSYCSYCRKNRT